MLSNEALFLRRADFRRCALVRMLEQAGRSFRHTSRDTSGRLPCRCRSKGPGGGHGTGNDVPGLTVAWTRHVVRTLPTWQVPVLDGELPDTAGHYLDEQLASGS